MRERSGNLNPVKLRKIAERQSRPLAPKIKLSDFPFSEKYPDFSHLYSEESLIANMQHVERLVPDTIQTIIDTDEFAAGESAILVSAFLLSADAPLLRKVWEILEKELDIDRAFETGHPEFAVRAFFIASTFIHQSQLPFAEKARASGKQVELFKAFNQRPLPIHQEKQDASLSSPIDSVKKAVNKFLAMFQQLEVKPTQKNDILPNLKLLNVILSQKDKSLYGIFMNYASNKDKAMLNKMVEKALDNTFEGNEESHEELLLQGALEGMASDIQSATVLNVIGSKLPRKEIIKYFLEHPKTQDMFWEWFYNKDITKKWRGKTAINLFSQDESLTAILNTIPEIDNPDSPNVRTFLNRFLGLTALLKTQNPDNPNIPALLKTAEDIATKIGIGTSTAIFYILQDQIPGAICVDGNDNVILSIPKGNHSKESFLVRQKEQEILYASEAEWPEIVKEEPKPQAQNGDEAKVAPAPKEHPLASVTGETEFLPLWGEVLVPKPEDSTPIWELINQRMSSVHKDVTHQNAQTLLREEEQARRHGENYFVIIPELISNTVPGKVLKDLGVIGIEQRNGQVTIILNLNMGNGEANSKRFVLSGELTNFDNLSLRTLFRIAILMGKRSVIEQTLSREEIAEIRARTNTWNKKVALEHLPQIAFHEDPRQRPANSPQTITFLGKKKPVILTLTP